jgi:hypothetical protein
MLVAVAPTKLSPGIDAAKDRVVAPSVYQVIHVSNLLDEAYKTDAHFVTYVVHAGGSPVPAQPRINKGGLEIAQDKLGEVLVYCLAADVDNPGHSPWRSHEDARQGVDRLALGVPTAIVYATARGLRLIQPLIHPVDPWRAESATAAWVLDLEKRGIKADPSCVDWTRHFRAPNVVRDGKIYRSPAVERRCEAIPVPAGGGYAKRARRRGQVVDVAFARTLPLDLERAADELGRAIAPHAEGHLHDLALQLAGVLLRRGVRAEHVPPMIGRIVAPHSRDVSARVRDAEDTARRYMGRLPTSAKLDAYPGLSVAVLRAFGDLPEEIEEPSESLEETTARLLATVRGAGDGVTLIRAQCGLGKTRAVRVVAQERARAKPLRMAYEDMLEPPAGVPRRGSRTALSVPTNKLAIEQQRYLEADGVPVARYFGPLSLLGPDGEPECKYAKSGRALAVGGLSVAFTLCRGCDHRETCKAKDGLDGPADAAVAIGPHELVGELAAHAGSTGILAVDEPPGLLSVESITLEDITRAEAELGWFESRYAACMRPILFAVKAWMVRGADPEAGPILRGLTTIDPALEADAFEATGETELLRWAEVAMGERTGSAPPLKDSSRYRVRIDTQQAKACGQAARVFGLIRRAVLDHDDVAAAVEDQPLKDDTTVRRLVLIALERRMQEALQRVGPTLVLAADADVARPLLARALGYEPRYEVFRAPEVDVDRTIIRLSGASRTAWLGHEPAAESIARALRLAVDWWIEGPTDKPLAVVTYLRVADALRGNKSQDAALSKSLRPIIERLPTPPLVGHYGALRGLDDWRDLDALVSVGDPYPPVGLLERQSAWVRSGGQSLVTPDDWARDHAAAELEQVHGRLRTVHRLRPARQLHVGQVLPAGWTKFRVRDGPIGRPRGAEHDDIPGLIERNGGPSAVAKTLGVATRTVQRWAVGERRPPLAVLCALSSEAGFGKTE